MLEVRRWRDDGKVFSSSGHCCAEKFTYIRCLYFYEKSFQMKALLTLLFNVFALVSFAQTPQSVDSTKRLYAAEAACGQCKFGLKGKGCSLAVRINGTAYFVDGTGIDDHGDAHAKDGFCNKIRRAKVQGEVANGRFKARYFQLLPEVVKKSN